MKSRKNRWSLALRYILLLLGGAVSVMPMIYMLSTSLRPNGALYEFPPHFFPKLSEITLENYRYIFAQEKFYLNFINSVIVAVITIVLAAIIASALVDTGSKMDEVIFEEFKGTGNMELKLDRDLADKRIFPAIDPVASGTRNEDLLIESDYQPLVWGIRRVLANMNNVERAANALVRGLKETDSNEEFLIKSAKKANQTGYVG